MVDYESLGRACVALEFFFMCDFPTKKTMRAIFCGCFKFDLVGFALFSFVLLDVPPLALLMNFVQGLLVVKLFFF